MIKSQGAAGSANAKTPIELATGERRRTGLAGSVETQHQQAHFLTAKHLGQRAGDCGAHGCGCGFGVAMAVIIVLVLRQGRVECAARE